FGALNELGGMTCALSDGRDLAIHVDRRGAQPVFLWELVPPYENVVFGDDDLQVDLTRRGVRPRRGVIVTTGALVSESGPKAQWRELAPGSLVVLRQGHIVSEHAVGPAAQTPPRETLSERVHQSLPVRPRTAPPRRLEVRHRTIYRYATPVER